MCRFHRHRDSLSTFLAHALPTHNPPPFLDMASSPRSYLDFQNQHIMELEAAKEELTTKLEKAKRKIDKHKKESKFYHQQMTWFKRVSRLHFNEIIKELAVCRREEAISKNEYNWWELEKLA